MTKKRDNGEGVRRAAAERREIASKVAEGAQEAERTVLATRGINAPISDEDLDGALVKLSFGIPMITVTEEMGVTRSALLSRATVDPDFRERLRSAQEMGAYAIVENSLLVAEGKPGYSSGSIERDKLIVDTKWRWGKTIGNRIFGDKLQVDQRTISITLRNDATEW